MTLEDFFTLTELKDGLTTPPRVNELLTVMQKEKECDVKSVGEATRQWSAVASTIATTENKDCLDLFIQLDGLWFIDGWLKDAQKFGNDNTGNSFLEELITALLRALERLQLDSHRSMSSGIERTVQGLLGHSSSVVRDKAKALCDGWMPTQDIDTAPMDAKKIEALGDGTECPVAISPCGNDNKENVEQSGDQKMLSVCSDTVQQARDKEETPTQGTTMESVTTNQNPQDPVDSSSIAVSVSGNLAVKVESDRSKSESTALTGVPGSTLTVPGSTCEEQSDISQLDKHVEDAKEKQEIDSFDKAGAVELTTTSSSPLEHKTLPSSADVDSGLESAVKIETREDASEKDEDMMDVGESPDHCHSTMAFNTRSQIGDSSAGALQASPGAENKWGEADIPRTTSNTESDEGAEDAKKHVGIQSDDDSGNHSHFSKRSMKAQDGDLISKRPSDMELDCGMVDPLELARQVANAVEREVDSRERSCSTSQNTSGSGIERPNSPDSKSEKECLPTGGSGKEVSSGPGPSPKASASAAEHVNDVKTLASKMESCRPNIPATQIPEMAQESAPNAERGFSSFDLNQEVSSEETDCPGDPVLTPISVVSASRAAATDGLPIAPLQFEGTLGWKGSAATSAFRRISEAEKAFSSSGSRSNSKQHLDRLDFDLNVAEGNDDKIEDLLSRDKMPISSYLPSGEEPSAEASPRRLERLQLDLNSLGDGDAGTIAFDWKHDGRVASLRQNGPQSPSLSSSSSSMQPSFRNIDLNLNDHSTIPNNASLDNPFLGKLFNNSNASGGAYKQEESVISIFGTQVEVRKDSVPLPNGRILDPAVDFSLGRTGSGLGLGSSMPYANLPAYGHNGFALGPAMSFSSPMYGPPGGPIPYMVDSRGAPIVPQIMGSSSSIPPAFSQATQPFLFNMATTRTSSGSNGAGPSHHNFDLNSGFLTEGGNRENNGGLRQFLNHSQGRAVDEQYLRMNNSLLLQPSSSSVVGGKRQEPDSGWEPFPINYKHQQPPWQ